MAKSMIDAVATVVARPMTRSVVQPVARTSSSLADVVRVALGPLFDPAPSTNLAKSLAVFDAVVRPVPTARALSGLGTLFGVETSFSRSLGAFVSFAMSMEASNKAWRRRFRRYAAVMGKLGWPPPIHLGAKEVDEILRLAKARGAEGARSEIEQILVNAYDSETLDEMVREWTQRPWLARYLAPLREAVELYKHDYFFGAVAVLVPLVEGLLVDAHGPNGKARTPYRRLAASVLTRKGADPLDRQTWAYLKGVHFNGVASGAADPDAPSRHGIAHGIDTAYGTRANALRKLVLVHLLQDAFGFVGARGGKVVHLPNCGVGRRIGIERRVVFRSLGEAESAGLRRAECCSAAITVTPTTAGRGQSA